MPRSKVTRSKRKSDQSKKIFLTSIGELKAARHKKNKLELYTQIIELLSKGYYKSEIAKELGISKQRVHYMCKKLEREGFIIRDYRTSIVAYRVYKRAWYNYIRSIEVKEKELGVAKSSVHFLKFRFPVLGVRKRLRRKHLTTPQGIGIDINNRSIIVWVPRHMVDSDKNRRAVAFDKVANAAITAFIVASGVAHRLGLRIGECELIPPIHVSGEFYMDFSRGVLELEREIFGKTVPDELPKRQLDYYI